MTVPLTLRQSALFHLMKMGLTDPNQLIELTGYSKSSVYYHLKKFTENGQLGLLRRKKRKKKLSVMQVHQIARASNNRKVSASQLAIKLNEICGVSVHSTTIHRTLKQVDFVKSLAHRSVVLTPDRKLTRLNWCQNNQNTAWSKVIFTDECSFCLFSNHVKIWKFRDEEQYFERPSHIPKLMVHGAISSIGKICLVIKKGSFNSQFYRDILTECMLPQAIELFNNEFILQQDNSSVHTAHIIRDALEERGVELLSWPPYSPDLHLIENIWFYLKVQVEKSFPADLRDLAKKVQEAWDAMPDAIIYNLYQSMANRIDLLINKGGGKIPY